jgi:hypothetical protein
MNQMTSEAPSDTTQPGYETSKATAVDRTGVALRPTLLFMTAFALNASPHEATHAVTAYMLGFSSTLYQMWVNPDAAAATPRQLIAIAVAGPIFSLTVGLISFVLYPWRYSRRPSGLLFLMLAIIAFYIPLGGSIFGDIHPDERDIHCGHPDAFNDDVLHGERTLFLGATLVQAGATRFFVLRLVRG